MSKADTTYHAFQKPGSQTDTIGFDDDFAAFKTYIDEACTTLGAYQSTAANAIGGSSAASNAGKIISSAAGARYGRVIGLAAAADATLVFQDHPSDPTTGTDKFVIGYDDSSDGFAINSGATIDATLADNDISIDSSGNVTFANNVTITGAVTLAPDLTLYDATPNGNPEILLGSTTADELHIQAVYDGGAQTLDYVLFKTDSANAVANKGAFKFNVDGTEILDIDDGGIDLITGKTIDINGATLLSASTLGASVLASDLTSVGTLGSLTMGGNISLTANNITTVGNIFFDTSTGEISGIQNTDLVDKSVVETITGVWTFSTQPVFSTTTSFLDEIIYYDAVNGGDPQIRVGATDAEELHIQVKYNSGTQILSHVLFQTDTAGASSNDGLFRFNVDGLDVLDIDDGGINFVPGRGLSFNGTTVLSGVLLGSTIVTSSLTAVGALGSGSITSGFGTIDTGLSNITTGGQFIVDADGSEVAAAGSITLGTGSDTGLYFDGQDFVIDTNNGSNGGIKLDSGDNTVEILAATVSLAIFNTAGLNLVSSGDAYRIALTDVLTATSLGSGVLASSLTSVGTLASLAVGSDVTIYEPSPYANPRISLGASGSERMSIQAVYDSSAQTLNYIQFDTNVVSNSDDKGLYQFLVDNSPILDIRDDGLNLDSGKVFSIAGTEVLNNTTLASGVTLSSLTTVGTLSALTMGGNIAMGGQNITGLNSLFHTEQAVADSSVGAQGQIWVKNDNPNTLWFTDDTGTDWEVSFTADSGAPSDAKYIVQTASSGLSAEQIMGDLATGIVKNTTTTGVQSIATAGTDYYAPSSTDVALADGGTGSSTASAARSALGVAIDSDVVAHSDALDDLTNVGIVTGNSYMLVGTGSGALAWETTTVLRSSIGVGTGDSPTFAGMTLTGGLAVGTSNITGVNSIFFDEQATADTDVPADGQLWVKNDDPNTLWFTDDAGADWEVSFSADSGAPSDATYIVQTASSGLSAEQIMGDLGTGLVRNAATTGVQSIATAGTHYYAPGGSDVSLADGGTGVSLSDPGADRVLFWDDTAGNMAFLAVGTGLTITGTTMTTIDWTNASSNLVTSGSIAGIANGNLLDKSATETVSGDWIFTGVLTITQSATPTVNADGEIALDTTVTDWSHGIIRYYGGEEMFLVAMPVASLSSPGGGEIVAYNATNDEFELVTAGGLGDVTASSNMTDHSLVRGHGGAKGVQDSGILINDSDQMSAVAQLTMSGDVVMADNSVTGINTITFNDTAGTIAGIQNQNLLDKSATETVSGAYTFSASTTTVSGDLLVDGGDIGITGDTNLMQLAADALTLNGSLEVVGTVMLGGDGTASVNTTLMIDRDFTATSGTPEGILSLGAITITGGTSDLRGTVLSNSFTIDSGGAHDVTQLYVNEPGISETDGSAGWASTIWVNGRPTEGVKNAGVLITQGNSTLTPNTGANALVIENNGDVGMSILTLVNDNASIYFGSDSTPTAGFIQWNGTTEDLRIGTNLLNAELKFYTNTNDICATFSSTGHLTLTDDLRVDGGDIGITGDTNLMQLAASALTVNGSLDIVAGASGATPNGAGDDLVITGSGSVGMSILTPNNEISRFYMGSPTEPRGFQLQWDYTNTRMILGTVAGGEVKIITGSAATALTIDSSQNAEFVGNADFATYMALGSGSSVDPDWTMVIDRDFSSASNARTLIARGIQTITGGTSSIIGAEFDTNFTFSGSGTHAIVTQAFFDEPTLSMGSATATWATTIYVDGMPSEGTKNAGILMREGNSDLTPHGSANALVIEHTNTTGLNILAAAGNCNIYMGVTTNVDALIQWVSASTILRIASNHADGELRFHSGPNNKCATFDKTGHLTLTDDLRVDGGDIGITGDTNLIQLAANNVTINGTIYMDHIVSAPATQLNKAALYAKDVSSSTEMFVMDEAGNESLISPHDREGYYIYRSSNRVTGHYLGIEVEKLLKRICDDLNIPRDEYITEALGEENWPSVA